MFQQSFIYTFVYFLSHIRRTDLQIIPIWDIIFGVLYVFNFCKSSVDIIILFVFRYIASIFILIAYVNVGNEIKYNWKNYRKHAFQFIEIFKASTSKISIKDMLPERFSALLINTCVKHIIGCDWILCFDDNLFYCILCILFTGHITHEANK